MGTDFLGDWDGICACGKKEADGRQCILGATHETLAVSQARYREANPHLVEPGLPWVTKSIPAPVAEPSFPWLDSTCKSSGTTESTDLSPTPWTPTT